MKFKSGHPLTSNLFQAPGAVSNPDSEKIREFYRQNTYMEWEPGKKSNIEKSSFKYDKVLDYDITKH